MARRPAKSRLSREGLEILAQRFRALADPTRLALLQALFDRERTVQELCAKTGASQANASKHLALLLERGLVARRRDSLFTRYRIADPTLQSLCRLVCGSLAERHEAVRARLVLTRPRSVRSGYAAAVTAARRPPGPRRSLARRGRRPARRWTGR